MTIYSLGDRHPVLGRDAWVAPNATVIGDVRLGDEASIWWNAVLRGDNDTITIGAGSNIQDGSVLHTDIGVGMTIGADVTVGHMVMLHGCTIGDGALIGVGARAAQGLSQARIDPDRYLAVCGDDELQRIDRSKHRCLR